MIHIITFVLTLQICTDQIDDQSMKYVFYLHGKIVEDQGLAAYSDQHGKYQYQAIINTLAAEGVKVLSEVRPKNTQIAAYAQKVADQITGLLRKGVAPDDITVIGASKGALIAMQISTLLKNKHLNYVFIAGSFDGVKQYYNFDLHGNILGFYEKSDPIAGQSYHSLIDGSHGVNKFKEVELNTNLGHGIVFKPLKEWVEPTKAWIK
ncbi:MAG: alpha/beta hydrolase [Cyclobacteriaceae bacterium]|nr:alpha/beta hydrolase [Cyclobacteriaceae bacterium]